MTFGDSMTGEQLDAIESALGLKLPAEYRRASLAFPFRPIGRDWVHWFFDRPDWVIGESRTPLRDGDYDLAGWHGSFVVIGESAAGDLYFIDAARDDSPVFILLHETHALEEEWPSFAAFLEDWLRINKEMLAQQDAVPRRLRWALAVGIAVVVVGIVWSLVRH